VSDVAEMPLHWDVCVEAACHARFHLPLPGGKGGKGGKGGGGKRGGAAPGGGGAGALAAYAGGHGRSGGGGGGGGKGGGGKGGPGARLQSILADFGPGFYTQVGDTLAAL
jgi:hypothetical protein